MEKKLKKNQKTNKLEKKSENKKEINLEEVLKKTLKKKTKNKQEIKEILNEEKNNSNKNLEEIKENIFVEIKEIKEIPTPVLEKIAIEESIDFIGKENKSDDRLDLDEKKEQLYQEKAYNESAYNSENKYETNSEFIIKEIEMAHHLNHNVNPQEFFKRPELNPEINPELQRINKQTQIQEDYTQKAERINKDVVKLPFEQTTSKYKPIR